jgi:hypothetical protein
LAVVGVVVAAVVGGAVVVEDPGVGAQNPEDGFT